MQEALHKNVNDRAAKLLRVWHSKLASPTHRVWIISFSAEGDDLSQWRGYGPIAIGFEPDSLTMHAQRATLQPVEYRLETQRNLALVYLSHMTQAYEADLSAGLLNRIPDVYEGIEQFVEVAAFFKDPSFEVEREYRFAYIEHEKLLQSLGLEPPARRFRVSRTKLLPYVLSDELVPPASKTTPLEIREVVLGPESDDLLEPGVREFLTSSKMPNVQVRKSIVPYRT